MKLLDIEKWRGGKRKRRKLINMEVDEISLVDQPANKIPFMILKAREESRKNDKVEVVKADNLDINIKTNFTVAGTSLSINGVAVTNPKDISFNMWQDETGVQDFISFAYSIATEGEDGARTSTRYEYRNKNEKELKMKPELEKTLKTLFGEVPDGFAELNAEEQEEMAKSLAIVEEYVDDMPPALKEAIGKITLSKKDSVISNIVTILEDAVSKIKDKIADEKDESDNKEDSDDSDTSSDSDDKEEDKEEEDDKEESDDDKDDKESDESDSEDKKDDDEKDDKSDEKEEEGSKDEDDKKDDSSNKEEEEVNLTQEEIDSLAAEAVEAGLKDVLGE